MENKLISILSANQMRLADQFTIENEPISSIKLMERAAYASFQWITDHFTSQKNFHIFCGNGNNGGDGLVIARLLHENSFFVKVYCLGNIESGSSDFRHQLEQLQMSTDVTIHKIVSKSDFPDFHNDDIIIDALYGTGLNRPLEGLSIELVSHINGNNSTVISIDLPSGLFCEDNSNNSEEKIIQAIFTLAFERPKLSFMLADFGWKTGNWKTISIGLNQEFLNKLTTDYFLITKSYVQSILKERQKFSHKGTFGHSLIISGSIGKMGAAVLATRAALNSGVGLVTTFVPACGYDIIQTTCPEAMCLTSSEFDFINGDIQVSNFQSIGIGPGIGTNPKTAEFLLKILRNITCPIVLDADALSILSEKLDWIKFVPENSILTPHPKEFDRLFGKSATAYHRLILQKKKSKELNLFILLKGAHTSLSLPSGQIYFNSTGNSGMAKGGSGDVLTGIITSLLAQQYSPENAAIMGMYLHGLAGDQAKGKYTEYAMNATQLIDCIPEAYSILLSN